MRIAEISIELVERISAKIKRARVEPSFFSELSKKTFDHARRYIDAVEKDNLRAGDRVKVFNAVYRLSIADVLIGEIIQKGLISLNAWWADVEGRPVVDVAACEILHKMVTKLDGMEARMAAIQPETNIIQKIRDVRRDLEFRGAKLQASLG